MSSLFGGDKASASKPVNSASRLSPRLNLESKFGNKPLFSSRSSLPAKMSSDEKAEGMSALRKSPLSFQQMTTPNSQNRSTRPEQKQFGGEVENITAWQNDMESIEQAQSQIQTDQMNLLHSQIHILTRELGDLQKHVVALTQKVEDGLAEHAQVHSAALSDLEAKLQNDLQNVTDTHSQALQSLNDEHQEKHAQNAQTLESGLQDVLESTHSKLQEELNELRHGGAGSLKDMGKILAEVTEEVDKINQAVEQEHELRMAVEAKLDEMCGGLRSDLELSFQESHAALKLELAEISGNSDSIKDAMQQAHAALKNEFDAHKAAADQKYEQVQDAMNNMNEEHHERHAQNAEKLEQGIENVLGGTHAKLQEELSLLKSGGAANLQDLQKVLADVTQQVDNIDQAVQQEHQLRMAVEARLDKMFNDQDKVISDLSQDMKVALNESHAALKLELAEHGKSAEEIKAAMAEANAALKEETKLAHGSLKDELQSLAKSNDERNKQMQDELSKVHEEHSEKHAQNAEKLEAGLENVLGNTHAKLQEELKLLKGGSAGSLKDLQKILTDVTEQVDSLDQALKTEHELRMAVETKLDQMFNDQEKIASDLRKDMKVALNESHSALKLELAEHGKNAEEIKAAMEDANAALKEEAKLAHGSLKNELQSLSKNTEAMHKKTKDELSRDMKSIHEEHTEKHAQNAEKLEAGLENVLGNTHAKLQEELKTLKSGGAGSLKDLQKILADVTQQVDNLDQAVEREHELRMAVETKLDQMFSDQDKVVTDLRRDMKVALNESHAALKLELAEHGKNAREIKVATEDAVAALQGETKLAHGSLKNELTSLSRGSEGKHKQGFDELKKGLLSFQSEQNEKHALTAERLEGGFQNLKVSLYETQQALKGERAAREVQDKTFLEFINDVRQQKEAQEATMQEQLRLERVAREVQASQLRDAVSQQNNWAPNAEYTDLLLQERSSRESAVSVLDRRIESFERAMSMERNERATEMQRLWDVFDGHTHEALSNLQVPHAPQVQRVRAVPTSPRASLRPAFVETVRPMPIDTVQVAERMRAPSVETVPPIQTVAARSPVQQTRMIIPTTATTGGGSVTLAAGPF